MTAFRFMRIIVQIGSHAFPWRWVRRRGALGGVATIVALACTGGGVHAAHPAAGADGPGWHLSAVTAERSAGGGAAAEGARVDALGAPQPHPQVLTVPQALRSHAKRLARAEKRRVAAAKSWKLEELPLRPPAPPARKPGLTSNVPVPGADGADGADDEKAEGGGGDGGDGKQRGEAGGGEEGRKGKRGGKPGEGANGKGGKGGGDEESGGAELPPVFTRVPTDDKVVFLTIDDGTEKDPRLLRMLRELEIPASFFITHSEARDDYGYFRAAYEEGVAVHNHSVSHPELPRMSYAEQREEICRQQDTLAEEIGERPRMFRPPYGAFNRDTLRAAAECGADAVPLWSQEAFPDRMEWARPDQEFHPGDIILTHFRGSAQWQGDMIDMMRRVLDTVTEQGFAVARLEDYV